MKQPVGIETMQTKKLLNYENPEQDFIEYAEKLIYSFPKKLQTQTLFQPAATFSVESNYKFIKITDGFVNFQEKPLVDMYSDILLYRGRNHILTLLSLSGIDTTAQVSLQRHSSTICYVIGQRPDNSQEKSVEFSGLWIEKNTMLPFRYIIKNNKKKVEFLYQNWQKVSETFYPMQIDIFLNDKLYAVINAKTIYLKSDFRPDLFDIENIKNLYPKQAPANQN